MDDVLVHFWYSEENWAGPQPAQAPSRCTEVKFSLTLRL